MADNQPTTQAAPTSAPNLRRPGDDIPNRPQLRVRPRTTPTNEDVTTSAAPLRRIVPNVDATEPIADVPEEVSDEEKVIREAKTLVVPPLSEGARNPFTTYGPPPPDEKAQEAELAALTRRKVERTVSTGFVLGIALVLVVLVGGIWLTRLGKKVAGLENRLNQIEGRGVHTAALDLP